MAGQDGQVRRMRQLALRLGVAALLLVLAVPALLPLASADAPPAATYESGATSRGAAIIGFLPNQFPADVGPSWLGFPVVREVPGVFIVVAASDLDSVHHALDAANVLGVRYVEDDGTVYAASATQLNPDDPRYTGQYGPKVMGFPAAWGAAGYGSSDIIVAIVDSGVDRTHPDLDATRILPGKDFVHNDSNPEDDCGHGTHVTGTVGARTNNTQGVSGMSQATILPLKVLAADLITGACTGSESSLAQAIYEGVSQGARVISMSLTGTSDLTNSIAVQFAAQKGVILVAAAGNDGASTVSYPAAYPEVIGVSAVDSTLTLASYSNHGAQISVAAPGSAIDSTYLYGLYKTDSGTSMAAPHVSGAIALALSCAPTATAQEVRDALEGTAQDLGAPGKDNNYGFGLARADLLVAELCGVKLPPPPPPPPGGGDQGSTTGSTGGSKPNKTASNDLVLDPIGQQTVRIGSVVDFLVTATGPGPYTFSITGAPGTSRLDPVTHRFQWAPRPGDLGRICPTVTVTNPQGQSSTRTFCILSFQDATDFDRDGVQDGADNCRGVSNREQEDSDDDGIGDACENDGSQGAAEPSLPNATTDPSTNGAQTGHAAADRDHDGVPDARDDCASTANADQADFDADGTGDACDLDKDGDEVLDVATASAPFADNCPDVPNPDQRDTDGDGAGDACPRPTAPATSKVSVAARPTAAAQKAGGLGAMTMLIGLLGVAAFTMGSRRR